MVESSGRGMRMAKHIAIMKYLKANYEPVMLRVKGDSNIAESIDYAAHKSGETKTEYVRNALTRKLTKDGFLPPKE